MLRYHLSLLLIAYALTFFPTKTFAVAEERLRVGYFPNVTHAHALVAQNLARENATWLEERLPGITVDWHAFNAGPSAMESLFAKAIDITYVGPSPVLNAFVRSNGEVIILAGAVRGGAALVIPQASPLASPEDFRGKRIATPQIGNTQDIACRQWLARSGLQVPPKGRDAFILPVANPMILSLFLQGEIDAAWTVEPWVSRLLREGGGRILYAEPAETSITTVLAAGAHSLASQPEAVGAFSRFHADLTRWIAEHPEEARRRVADEMARQMRREFPIELIEDAWPRLVFSNAVTLAEFHAAYEAAKAAGFLSGNRDLNGLVRADD